MNDMVIHPPFPLGVIVIGGIVLLVAGTFFTWHSTRQSAPLTRCLILLTRWAAVSLLFWVALNPGRWVKDQRDDESRWAVLVDRSPSMATSDGADGTTRLMEAKAIASEVAARDAKAAIHTFSSGLDSQPESLEDITVSADIDSGTDLTGSLERMVQREAAGTLKGILLLTDGRQTHPVSRGELEQTVLRAQAKRAPVFAVPIGGEVVVQDLVVAAQRRQNLGFPGEPVRVVAEVSKAGLGAIRPVIHLIDDRDQSVSQLPVELDREDDSARAAFELRVDTAGVHSYAFKVDPLPGEHRTENNLSRFSVIALKERTRVLTVEGVPYWDSKFLAQLLRNRRNMEVTSIYRVSSDRFFKVESELAQAEESREVLFPGTADEMNQYDLLVLGKGMEYFLDPPRMELLRNFVVHQGGTVLFSRGKPYHGKFAELSEFEPVTWGDPIEQTFRLQPTQDGVREGIFGELLPGPDDGVWGSLPLLSDSHRVSRLKPFTKILANGILTTSAKESEFPVLIARRLGKGLVLTLNADGLWKWDFFPDAQQESGENMYQETWTQLIYWAATFSEFLPGQDYAIQLGKTAVGAGEPVRATVTYRGGLDHRPDLLKLLIRNSADATTQQTVLSEVGQSQRRWEGTIRIESPGHYQVQIEGAGGDVRELLAVQAPPRETDNLSADRAFLETLCTTSGGELVEAQDLPSLLEGSPQASDPMDDPTQIRFEPMWDSSWWLGGLLLALALDWYLRRRAGLL